MSSATLRPTPRQWWAGARPRTLPAAVSPVLVGSGLAYQSGGFHPGRALLCLVVSLALQVGVNYANDYSDGVRGADAVRVGPLRLVGSGLAHPRLVKRAAFASFGAAGLAGTLLVLLSGHPWLLLVGAAAVLAAWFYTGGPRPYGYLGLGEVFVFVFFGLVAVAGTTYVQVGRLPGPTWPGAVAVGALACAILVANNLRDLAADAAVGKRTLATRLGDRATRLLYAGLVALAGVMVGVLAGLTNWAVLLGLLGLAALGPAIRTVLTGATGAELIGVLRTTGTAELFTAVGITLGLVLGVR